MLGKAILITHRNWQDLEEDIRKAIGDETRTTTWVDYYLVKQEDGKYMLENEKHFFRDWDGYIPVELLETDWQDVKRTWDPGPSVPKERL